MYVALHMPGFPLAVLGLGEAGPSALVDTGALRRRGSAPIREHNQAAAARGVEKGMSVTRALSRCPALHLVEPDPAKEEQASTLLRDHARHLAADLETTAPGTILLDVFAVRDFQRDHPRWLASANDGFPFPLNTAAAPTPDLAHLAALAGIRQWTDEAMALDIATLAALGAAASWIERWRTWGVHTLRDLAALPAGGIAARLGRKAARFQRIVRGTEHRMLRLCREPADFGLTLEPEHALDTLEPLLFLCNRALGVLLTRLEAAHRAAGAIDLELGFADDSTHRNHMRLAEPSRQRDTILGVLAAHLEQVRAKAPLTRLHLALSAQPAPAVQEDFLRGGVRDERRFRETLSRIESMLGEGRVGVPVPLNSHLPDAFALEPCTGNIPPPEHTALPHPAAHSGACAFTQQQREGPPLQRFRPPCQVAVVCDRRRPAALLDTPFAGPVSACRGPFHSSGGWWDAEAWRREEWDVEMPGGRILRLTRLPGRRWHIEGVYT